MQPAITMQMQASRGAAPLLGDRVALAGSGCVLALLGLAYWLANFVLPGRVSPDLNLYLLRPLIWGSAGLLALFLHQRLADRPRANRLLLGLALVATAFHVSALLCTGVLFGFGHSPYARGLLGLSGNVWYLAALVFAFEVSRAYLLAVWSRYNTVAAFLGVSLLMAALWIAPGQYEQLSDGESVLNRISRVFVPGASESLLASFLAGLGGPLPAFIYHFGLEGFRWVSPILPRLSWEMALLVGTLVPAMAMLIVRDSYFAGAEESTAPAKKGRVFSSAALVLASLIVALIWLNTGMLGVRPALVSGPSMKPYLGPGDMVIIKEVDPAALKVGDIVKFRSGSHDVIHRVIALTPGPDGLFVFTQGDSNNVADAPLPARQVDGKVVLKLPLVGWVPIKLRELVN